MAGRGDGKLGGGGRIGRAGLAIAAALGVAAGCGGGEPVAMSGRQVLNGRDVANLFFWKDHTVGFTRATTDPSQPEPSDFWVLPVGAGDETPAMALPGVRWEAPDSWPLWVAGDLMLTGTKLERIYDVESRQGANLLDEFGLTAAPSAVSLRGLLEMSAMRSDGHALARLVPGEPPTVIVGRPSALRAFPLPAGSSVGSITFLGTDVALLLRQTTDAGDVVGVQRLDTTTGALTPLGTATAAAEWTGTTGFCDRVPPTLPCGFFMTFGCSVGAPACPGGEAAPCLVLYAKVDPDDTTRTAAYAHDVGAGTTRKLAGTDPEGFFAHGGSHVVGWRSATSQVTHTWNTCSGAQQECPFSGEMVTWRPDGGSFAIYGSTDLRIVDVAAGSCGPSTAAGSLGVYQAQFSSDGNHLFWIAPNDPERTSQTLWLADGGAQSPVAITSGPFIGATFTADGQHMYVAHVSESTSALGWVDVNAPSPTELILSTNYGDVGVLGDRRAVFVDHWNVQDGNGELVVMEPGTGMTETLARGVTAVAVSNTAEGADVAYTVRGRAASSRDGLWLATLPP
jgi:hypothetical protein